MWMPRALRKGACKHREPTPLLPHTIPSPHHINPPFRCMEQCHHNATTHNERTNMFAWHVFLVFVGHRCAVNPQVSFHMVKSMCRSHVYAFTCCSNLIIFSVSMYR